VGSLWTPEGEHPVGDATDAGQVRSGANRDAAADEATDEALDEAAIRAQIDEARARVADVPAELIVTNHAMGLYELAAIHLAGSPPDLGSAALAIDGFACLVEGLGDRLGPDAATLRDALAQIRLAFVQIKGTVDPSPAEPSGAPDPRADDAPAEDPPA
jgi:hypothetical protein